MLCDTSKLGKLIFLKTSIYLEKYFRESCRYLSELSSLPQLSFKNQKHLFDLKVIDDLVWICVLI